MIGLVGWLAIAAATWATVAVIIAAVVGRTARHREGQTPTRLDQPLSPSRKDYPQ